MADLEWSGCLVLECHSEFKPFNIRTTFDHSVSVWYSSPHCIQRCLNQQKQKFAILGVSFHCTSFITLECTANCNLVFVQTLIFRWLLYYWRIKLICSFQNFDVIVTRGFTLNLFEDLIKSCN